MPDGKLVAALIKSATGPPPKLPPQQATAQDPLPPSDSPYFHVAADVAKAMVDFDLNRTLTAADLSRRLGERRREAGPITANIPRLSEMFVFGSSKLRRVFLLLIAACFPSCGVCSSSAGRRY
jgi:hypothetical protein